jgi:hypothetical protein
MNNLDNYKCRHGIIGACDYCWAEGFRERRLNNTVYRKQVEALIEEDKAKNIVTEGDSK